MLCVNVQMASKTMFIVRKFADESFDMIICHNVLEDAEIEKWCPELLITKVLGMRTFWDMQQNQEIHKDVDWQDKMVDIEMRVSDMDVYKEIAFFHHLTIEKKQEILQWMCGCLIITEKLI